MTLVIGMALGGLIGLIIGWLSAGIVSPFFAKLFKKAENKIK